MKIMKMVRERILADGGLQYRVYLRRTGLGVAGGCWMDSLCRAMHDYSSGGDGSRGSSLFRKRGWKYRPFFLTPPLSAHGISAPRTRRRPIQYAVCCRFCICLKDDILNTSIYGITINCRYRLFAARGGTSIFRAVCKLWDGRNNEVCWLHGRARVPARRLCR